MLPGVTMHSKPTFSNWKNLLKTNTAENILSSLNYKNEKIIVLRMECTNRTMDSFAIPSSSSFYFLNEKYPRSIFSQMKLKKLIFTFMMSIIKFWRRCGSRHSGLASVSTGGLERTFTSATFFLYVFMLQSRIRNKQLRKIFGHPTNHLPKYFIGSE